MNSTSIKTTGEVRTEVIVVNTKIPTNLLLVPGLREEVILGNDWLKEHQALLDYSGGCIHLGRKDQKTVFWHDQLEPSTLMVNFTSLHSTAKVETKDSVEEES